MRECFLPHWGLASQWWLWCWWHQPWHFSACLLFTVHATHPHKHYQRLHPPLQATHQRRRYVLCVCVCKRGEEWKKVPFNSSARIPSPGWEQRRKERGKKKLSIPMCRGQYKHSPPVFRQLQSDSVPFRLLLTDWLTERERERERERQRERGGRDREREREREREGREREREGREREREGRERERERCQSFSICAGCVSFVSHQTRWATFHLCAFSSSLLL